MKVVKQINQVVFFYFFFTYLYIFIHVKMPLSSRNCIFFNLFGQSILQFIPHGQQVMDDVVAKGCVACFGIQKLVYQSNRF